MPIIMEGKLYNSTGFNQTPNKGYINKYKDNKAFDCNGYMPSYEKKAFELNEKVQYNKAVLYHNWSLYKS
jgi:hypothetical protein